MYADALLDLHVFLYAPQHSLHLTREKKVATLWWNFVKQDENLSRMMTIGHYNEDSHHSISPCIIHNKQFIIHSFLCALQLPTPTVHTYLTECCRLSLVPHIFFFLLSNLFDCLQHDQERKFWCVLWIAICNPVVDDSWYMCCSLFYSKQPFHCYPILIVVVVIVIFG